MKRNFNRLNSIIFLMVLIQLVSCGPDDYDWIQVNPVATIAELDIKTVKGLYQGTDLLIDTLDNYKEINITGSVISDPESGNTPEGYLILQYENTGIALLLKDSTEHVNYPPNEVLKVNILNDTLKKVDGNLVITGVSHADITRTGEISYIIPREITLKELSDNFETYNETLVKVNLVGISPMPVGGDTYGGVKRLNDKSTSKPGIVNLFTFPNSELANKEIDTNAIFNYSGIAMYNVSSGNSVEKQIWLPNEKAIDTTTIFPVDAPFVITGFLANPTGYDQAFPGDSRSYLPHEIRGGFQYIQFMAIKDIDFSQTPYSLVTMVSYPGRPGATSDGWAAGGFITAKFDLNSGFAPKGSFFYVGSGSTLINGYSPDGFSSYIGDANWIRSTPFYPGNYTDIVGDPFANGNVSHGTKSWLDHRTDEGSDAIAIFKGTRVGANSIPVDAVFFNEDVGSTLDGVNGFGFTVPANDLYSPVDPVTGEPQPLFGEGTNTYAVPISLVNGNGVWVALGGTVTGSGFIARRDHPTGVQLYTYPGKSKLSDIEEGEGITVFK